MYDVCPMKTSTVLKNSRIINVIHSFNYFNYPHDQYIKSEY